jgi:DNA-binding response OmpR family regulator
MYSIIIIGNNENSSYLKDELKKLKYKVYSSSEPKQGLDKARHKLTDMIILDIQSKGSFIIFDIIKEIKSDIRICDSIIIVLSNNTDEMDKILSLELGADDYLIKPVTLTEILVKIKCYLKNKVQKNKSAYKREMPV